MPDIGVPQFTQPFVDDNKRITQGWRQFLVLLAKAVDALSGGGGDPGDVKISVALTLPAGWVVCNGQALGRTTFSDLFAAIGTTWGVGDGSTTFNVPDFRDRAPIGVSGTKALGTTGGQSAIALTIPQLPAHTHVVNDPGHIHGVNDPGHHHETWAGDTSLAPGASFGNIINDQTHDTSTSTTGISIQSHATGITLNNTGAGAAVSTQSPYAAVNWIIKA